MLRPVKFSTIAIDQPFTPQNGTVGAGTAYLKKVNGICPKIGTKEEGIFYPEDLVYPMKVPYSYLKPHLNR